MKAPVLDNLLRLKERKNISYETLEKLTGISASTLSRWFRGQGAPDVDDLDTIVTSMGGNMEDIFVAVGKQELIATQDIEYQGATAMIQHYEARIAGLREQIDMLRDHHKQALENRDATYDRSVTYLKDQVGEIRKECQDLHKELDQQRARADALEVKRHHVFWGMLAAIILILLLFGAAIIADLPQIGMGW